MASCAEEMPEPGGALPLVGAIGCDWPVAFSFAVDPAWPSGFYEIALQADGATGERAHSEAFFVVRPEPVAAAPAILVLATNTYNAYNQWGGACLYSGATKVSFARPIERGYVRRPAALRDRLRRLRRQHRAGGRGRAPPLPALPGRQRLPAVVRSSGWHSWERRFVRWAEGQGGPRLRGESDLEVHPEVLDGTGSCSASVTTSTGRGDARRADDFVESAVRGPSFSGNTCFWQVRYEDEGRTMVCYKGQYERDPVLGTDRASSFLSTMWSLPSIGRPECLTTGLSSHPQATPGRPGHAPGIGWLHRAPA